MPVHVDSKLLIWDGAMHEDPVKPLRKTNKPFPQHGYSEIYDFEVFNTPPDVFGATFRSELQSMKIKDATSGSSGEMLAQNELQTARREMQQEQHFYDIEL